MTLTPEQRAELNAIRTAAAKEHDQRVRRRLTPIVLAAVLSLVVLFLLAFCAGYR